MCSTCRKRKMYMKYNTQVEKINVIFAENTRKIYNEIFTSIINIKIDLYFIACMHKVVKIK